MPRRRQSTKYISRTKSDGRFVKISITKLKTTKRLPNKSKESLLNYRLLNSKCVRDIVIQQNRCIHNNVALTLLTDGCVSVPLPKSILDNATILVHNVNDEINPLNIKTTQYQNWVENSISISLTKNDYENQLKMNLKCVLDKFPIHIIAACATYLGCRIENVYVTQFAGQFIEPGLPDQKAHRDTKNLKPGLQLKLLLSTTDSYMKTTVVLGSHLDNFVPSTDDTSCQPCIPLNHEDISDSMSTVVTTSSTNALLFDPKIVHYGCANNTTVTRKQLVLVIEPRHRDKDCKAVRDLRSNVNKQSQSQRANQVGIPLLLINNKQKVARFNEKYSLSNFPKYTRSVNQMGFICSNCYDN